MKTKPKLTAVISESGEVFSSENVAKDIYNGTANGLFGISTGFDGWLLKQAHPGMTPINSFRELVSQVLVAGIVRIVSVFYLLYWDMLVKNASKDEILQHKENKKNK